MLGRPDVEFHAGVSYRNLMIYRGGRNESEPRFSEQTVTDPPHDHPDQPVEEHLPRGPGADLLRLLMAVASPMLAAHPVNRARTHAGKKPANAIWLWGQGKAPSVPTFRELHGLKGAIISAVDLVRGVGVLAGWTRIDVPGATGYLDTDYAAKGQFAIQALADHDIVCVHVEAPDEASHEGRGDAKVRGPGANRPRHRRPGAPGTQAVRPVADPDLSRTIPPCCAPGPTTAPRSPGPWPEPGLAASGQAYDEVSARDGGGPFFDKGYQLMEHFLDPSWKGKNL